MKKLIDKAVKQQIYLSPYENLYFNTEQEYKDALRYEFSNLEYVEAHIKELEEYIEQYPNEAKENQKLLDILKEIRTVLDEKLPPRPKYLEV